MENRSIAIQFNLPEEYFIDLKENGYHSNDIIEQIDKIMKTKSFKKELSGLYISHKANSVSGVLVAQELLKIYKFKDYVHDFKMYHINEIDCFNCKQLII